MSRSVCPEVEVYAVGESIHQASRYKMAGALAQTLVLEKRAIFRDHGRKLVIFPEPTPAERPKYDERGVSCRPGKEIMWSYAVGDKAAKEIIDNWQAGRC
jgi:hypothetical protein